MKTIERIRRIIEARLDERGIGTVELIFITVIVMGMAVLFREQIVEIFNNILERLEELSGNIKGGLTI